MVVDLEEDEVANICSCEVISMGLEHSHCFHECLHSVLLKHEVEATIRRLNYIRI